jgi:hypothetical protein
MNLCDLVKQCDLRKECRIENVCRISQWGKDCAAIVENLRGLRKFSELPSLMKTRDYSRQVAKTLGDGHRPSCRAKEKDLRKISPGVYLSFAEGVEMTIGLPLRLCARYYDLWLRLCRAKPFVVKSLLRLVAAFLYGEYFVTGNPKEPTF